MLGIQGRSGKERKNVFDYKASQSEPPVQIFRVDGDNLTPMLQDAIGLNPDGTLKAIEGRLLVVATADGKHHELRFPNGWTRRLVASMLRFDPRSGCQNRRD